MRRRVHTFRYDGREGSPALTREELDVLMQSADVDKNGLDISSMSFCIVSNSCWCVLY